MEPYSTLDPILVSGTTWRNLDTAYALAALRAQRRNRRQRVACLPLDDWRRTHLLARFVVTDA